MAYETIMLEQDGAIDVIKFNRPKALNAVNPVVLDEVADALDLVMKRGEAKVLILTGMGDKAFVAGADIAHLSKLSPLEARQFATKGHQFCFHLEALPIPVIACVNGFALGGGAEIALACDFIYASEKAKFGLPEINLGVMPGFGGTQRLSRRVGVARAKEIAYTGGMITAEEGREMGLVNKVFSSDALWDETMKTAQIMASKGRVSLKGIKDCMNRGNDIDLRDGCFMELDAFALCYVSSDSKEGLTAFLEKRTPEFKEKLC